MVIGEVEERFGRSIGGGIGSSNWRGIRRDRGEGGVEKLIKVEDENLKEKELKEKLNEELEEELEEKLEKELEGEDLEEVLEEELE
ncbi:hypothetical protein HPP92_009950 [Vanilla planifolia]|uniref:Uncharacterized protein n=1 Tax=Vanilla planifolia TaxID=51239 RepID=A0A835QY13_VANPL|nr:hypothetical protein HPP92_009950 [Vanilla planifolia]